jgi:hypothetical protein
MDTGTLAEAGASALIPGVGIGLGALELGMGIYKDIQAGNRRKKAQSFFDANKFQIPESAKGALSLAQRNASSVTLPGEDLTRARLGETTARGIGAAKTAGTSSADILTHLSSLFSNEERQDTNLGIAGANRWDANQRYLGSAMNNMAKYEVDKWKYNVLYPYQQMMGQAGQMEGQGNQMIGSGVGQAGAAVGAYGQMNAWDKQLEIERTRAGLGGKTTNPVSPSNGIDWANYPNY